MTKRPDLERLKAMRAENRTVFEMAQEFGCSQPTIWRWLGKLGLTRGPGGRRSEYNENPGRWAQAMDWL